MLNSGSTIKQMFSGGPFDILAPRARDIRALDIAESLSKINRFTGHTKPTYSVAQHCVLVSYLLNDTGFEMEGLFHDAHEYITGDISSPMKNAIREMVRRLTGEDVDPIKAIERPIDAAIAQQFGLIYPRPPQVKAADLEAMTLERRQLMNPASGLVWTTDVKARDISLNPLTAPEACAAWLARYNHLAFREKAVAS